MAGGRFIGAEVWRKLTADEQELLGGAVLELVVARHGVAMAEPRGNGTLYRWAEDRALLGLDLLGWHALARFGAVAPNTLPAVPAIAGRVCRGCGHWDTSSVALPPFGNPDHWAEDDLCAPCAGAAARVAG